MQILGEINYLNAYSVDVEKEEWFRSNSGNKLMPKLCNLEKGGGLFCGNRIVPIATKNLESFTNISLLCVGAS